jgi:hypothetical protein
MYPKHTFSNYIHETLYCPEEKRDMRNVIIADKVKVQQYIENIIGKESGIFDTRIWSGYDIEEAIKHIKVPCVIKANNAWRRMKFINSSKDITPALRGDLKMYLTDIRTSWEYYYQQIIPGLLIEEKLPNEHILYRVYVFWGKAKMYFIQRFDVSKNNWVVKSDSFHYATGEFIPVTWNNFPNEKHEFPDGLNLKLNEMAERIAKFPDGTPPYLRVDLYYIKGKIIFSELTMLPDSVTGHYPYLKPTDLDFEMGKWYEEAVK